MLCRGTVQEASGRRSCWLPADRSSKFQLCRRCHYHKATDLMDQLIAQYKDGTLHPSNEILLSQSWFLEDMLHPGREQALLNLLTALFQGNRIMFSLLLDRLKQKSVFSILLTKRIQTHQPGTRCCMYRQLFRTSELYTSDTLPWNCWSCIAWIFSHQEIPKHTLVQRDYTWGLQRLRHPLFLQTGPHCFVSLLSTFLRKEMESEIRLFFLHMILEFPLEEVRSFVGLVAHDPLFLPLVFGGTFACLLPVPLQDPSMQTAVRTQVKQSLKRRLDPIKEQLVEKTWHPNRLFRWCLDLEELVEFGFTGSHDERIIIGIE